MPRRTSVKTYLLTHVALAVRDPRRSLRFYQAVLGLIRRPRAGGKAGGIPDGYDVEIGYERPTPVDSPSRR